MGKCSSYNQFSVLCACCDYPKDIKCTMDIKTEANKQSYIVIYYEENICHCVLMVNATYEVEAKNKAIDYMKSKDIGYHYWDDFFRIELITEIKHIK